MEKLSQTCASLDERLAQVQADGWNCTPSDIAKIRSLVEAGLRGTLTEAEFYQLAGGPFGMTNSFLYRDVYAQVVSWAVLTAEYLNSVERLLRPYRVVEVCAGVGTLGRLMRARGLDWTTTDEGPVNDTVKKCDALAAVSIFKPEVVFASWIPYGSPLDGQLAEMVAERHIPMVVIGEGNGGCTGSDALYADDVPWEIHSLGWGDAVPWFKDVPQWSGIHDHTQLVMPPGSGLIWDGKGIFGPPV